MSPISLGVYGGARYNPPPAPTLNFVEQRFWTGSAASPYTFTDVALGPAIDRTVLIAVGVAVAVGGVSLGITVAGSAATIDVKNPTHTAAGIARIALPASVTSGNVVMATGASWTRSITVFYVPGTVQLVNTASNWQDVNNQAAAKTTVSGTIAATQPGDLVLAQVGSLRAWGTPEWTWTGPSEVNDSLGLSAASGSSAGGGHFVQAVCQPNVARYLGLAAAAYRSA